MNFMESISEVKSDLLLRIFDNNQESINATMTVGIPKRINYVVVVKKQAIAQKKANCSVPKKMSTTKP